MEKPLAFLDRQALQLRICFSLFRFFLIRSSLKTLLLVKRLSVSQTFKYGIYNEFIRVNEFQLNIFYLCED